MAEWSNWAGTVHAQPSETVMVRDVAHLQSVCAEATAGGRKVKAVGSGHSFTAIAEPTDTLVRMDRISGLRSVDAATGRVWALAGTPLHVLNPELQRRGLAMANLGDIDRQTLAGALSTGTHGTGREYTGLAGQVVGVEIVLADGSLLRVDDTASPELVPALALGLGALGVVTAYEIQCVPTFLLTAHEAPAELDAVLGDLDATVDGTDHFEFYWFPHTSRTLTKRNTRTTDVQLRTPLSRTRAYVDDELLSNRVFEVVNRVVTRVPAIIPAVNSVSARALSERTFTDYAPTVFASSRNVRFRESEFAVPRAALPDSLRELKSWLERKDEVVAFPVEIRFTAPDGVWMSTASERESAYIAVHQYHRRPHEAYFEAFWQIMRAYEGRPHWGKMHNLAAPDFAKLYPRFGEFVALRDKLDPTRTFSNPYLERVLG